MKNLFLFLFLIGMGSTQAQDVRFNASIYTEPQHYSTSLWEEADGFNIGLGIEYQMTIFYFEADVYYFPDLNGVDYAHFQGTCLGFNYHDRFRNFRLKVGVIKPGLIKRNWKYTYPMIGSDFGLEYYFDNGFYIGGEVSGDWRADDKFWDSSGTGFYSVSAGLKFGIHWN